MELMDYLSVLWRRWYIVVLVPLIVLAGVLYQATKSTTTYMATAQIAVTRAPEQPPSTNFFQYNDYYTYLASEYALDDFVTVVKGNIFANDVSKTIAGTDHVDISPSAIQTAITSSRLNRILSIHAQANSAQRAKMIAQAAAATLEKNGTSYFGYDSPARSAIFKTIQTANTATPSTKRRDILLALEVLIGLLAGILIAFFIEYIDDTLRSPETVSAALDLPVLATIPDGRRR